MSIVDQPQPVSSEGDVWATLIEEMQQRRLTGISRYGTPLQPFNGRNARIDLIQELLDALVYARQDEMERQVPTRGMRAVLGELVESVSRYDMPNPAVTSFAEDIDEWCDRLLKAAGFFRLQEQLRRRDQQLSISFTREALAAVLVRMNHAHWASILGSPTMSDEGRMDFALREVDGWLELVRRGHVPGVPARRAEDAGEQP